MKSVCFINDFNICFLIIAIGVFILGKYLKHLSKKAEKRALDTDSDVDENQNITLVKEIDLTTDNDSIHIADGFEKIKDKILNPDEIIVPAEEFLLIISYPLKRPAYIPIKTDPEGATKAIVIQAIIDAYKDIYEEEEKTLGMYKNDSTIPEVGQEEYLYIQKLRKKSVNVINRKETDGKYGIWGHDLTDLYLEGIKIYKDETQNLYIVYPLIGS